MAVITFNLKSKMVALGIALGLAAAIGGIIGYQLRPSPERFVQVNAFDQWRGFEVSGDSVRWVRSCGNGQPLFWRKAESVGLSLRGFTRESPLVYEHPSLGSFAKVDEFSPEQIGMAAANMRIILGLWDAKLTEGERFIACPSTPAV